MDFLTMCFMIGIPLMLAIGVAAYITINKKDKPKDYGFKDINEELIKKMEEDNKKANKNFGDK